MTWFLWIILGLALLVGEVLLAGSFFLIFFGAGAVIVGLLTAAAPGVSAEIQWVLFSVISLALLLVLRKKFAGGGARGVDADSIVGSRGRALENLAPNNHGQGEVRGSTWRVRNVGSGVIAAGDEFTVRAVQGISLDVEK